MKLTELNPRWFSTGPDRRGMGVRFDCPHCGEQRLGVAFANPVDGGDPAHLMPQHDGVGQVQYRCAPEWQRTGVTFGDLSLSPSIDFSAHGHWHGFIIDGEVR
jgi:hypothetical protein